jgi:hypothetical protein
MLEEKSEINKVRINKKMTTTFMFFLSQNILIKKMGASICPH